MSSSIDWFDCPKCGGNAWYEQDNRTCEITRGCQNCDWRGEDVDEDNVIREGEKVYVLTYRGEFTAAVRAKSKEEALNKAAGASWEFLTEPHRDMLEVETEEEVQEKE